MIIVGAQGNENFRGWNKFQKTDTTPVKTNGSKKGISFEKAGNITSVKLSTTVALRNILKLV